MNLRRFCCGEKAARARFFLANLIDTNNRDGNSNRAIRNVTFTEAAGVHKKRGIAISIGCFTGNSIFFEKIRRLGYAALIAPSGGMLTFGQSIIWVINFFEFLTRPYFLNQNGIEEMKIDETTIRNCVNSSNEAIKMEEEQYQVFWNNGRTDL